MCIFKYIIYIVVDIALSNQKIDMICFMAQLLIFFHCCRGFTGGHPEWEVSGGDACWDGFW